MHFTETTYRANTKWIVFEDAIRNENEFLKNSYIPLDTEFLLAKQPPDTKDVEISELFHVLPNTPFNSQTVGQWNLDTGLNWTNKSFSERRVDFHGSVIKATYAPFGKVLYFVENDKKLEFGGFAFEIWNTLENTLNFTTTFQKPTTGRFGAQSANGSWDGVTGMLQSKKVDMSLAPLILMNSRLSVIDYFVPVIRTSNIFSEYLQCMTDNINNDGIKGPSHKGGLQKTGDGCEKPPQRSSRRDQKSLRREEIRAFVAGGERKTSHRGFTRSILKMSEGGLLKVFDERLIPLKLRKKALEDVGTVATMEKVSTIFIILVAGIISSIVVLFLEMCYARYGLSSNFEK
ncbi:hypothetical protein C0J52_27576 [Blattella germanica]|nr:hypothetical protein C0J52_27576 [Blattella germanica]